MHSGVRQKWRILPGIVKSILKLESVFIAHYLLSIIDGFIESEVNFFPNKP